MSQDGQTLYVGMGDNVIGYGYNILVSVNLATKSATKIAQQTWSMKSLTTGRWPYAVFAFGEFRASEVWYVPSLPPARDRPH